MSVEAIEAGVIPLVDAAPLIVARELGFAEEEGLDLRLTRAPSWSAMRDMLVTRRIEAAHMLSPLPVAMAMGLGGMPDQIDVLMVLSVNGNNVTVSRALGDALRAAGYRHDPMDAASAGRALAQLGQPLTLGVPFPFSMHAELLFYWLTASGLPAPSHVTVRTIPPPLLHQALASGEIDAFCVAEPWGSMAVETGVGEILLPGLAIRKFAPEKVLAMRRDTAEGDPERTARLMRAVWRASRWLSRPEAHTTTAELLGRPEYLDVPAEIVDRALTGRFVLSPRGELRSFPGFVEFFDAAATFPWRSEAAWIATQIAGRLGLDRREAAEIAKGAFRTDLYRRHLADVGAVMPGASEKMEGALAHDTAVPSESGRLILKSDTFFDGTIFDPSA
ncbi:ABC transporter substrate-binding protein [Pseudoroseicyclus sp. H15]